VFINVHNVLTHSLSLMERPNKKANFLSQSQAGENEHLFFSREGEQQPQPVEEETPSPYEHMDEREDEESSSPSWDEPDPNDPINRPLDGRRTMTILRERATDWATEALTDAPREDDDVAQRALNWLEDTDQRYRVYH